ncbi:MAG: hypothetical protein H6Q69_131 [Firmicutes bacterium]|nr:hypothetical protein [Bacillota bacterium]MBP2657099.1 hypothetical protein [Bacillota bacterium]
MKKRMMFMVVLCLLMVGMMGTVAYAGDLDWKTTSVRNANDNLNLLVIKGYFTNNRADRVITKINWFQPNVTLTYGDGYPVVLNEKLYDKECYIEPGCTYEMTFYLDNPDGANWVRWRTTPGFNWHYDTIKG